MLGGQAVDQFVEVAVHDGVDFVEREIDAVIGDAALREVVSADAFGAVAAADQAFARGGDFRGLFAFLPVFEARGERSS